MSVDGYELKKIDEKNYELSVNKDISNIDIKAIAEDNKAKITGIGKKELKIGENSFEIVITSESGIKNVINIRVIRKDEYNLEDLNNLLNNSNINNIDISIDSDSIISKDILNKIKDSKKTVNLNVLDENKKNIYTWILDGSRIDESNDLEIIISNKTDYDDNILKLSNYADGIFLNFLNKNKIPRGIIIKLLVGDKYSNDDELNIYSYDNELNKLNLTNKTIVEDGYIYLDNIENNNYFITMSNIDSILKEEKDNNILFIVLSIIELLIIIGFINTLDSL